MQNFILGGREERLKREGLGSRLWWGGVLVEVKGLVSTLRKVPKDWLSNAKLLNSAPLIPHVHVTSCVSLYFLYSPS